MKKILFTLSALALCYAVNAQNLTTEKWPNGNKRSEGIVLGDAKMDPSDSKEVQSRKLNNTTKDGKWNTWFENGTVRSEEFYTKGAMTGTWKTWYDNGQLESEINFTAATSTVYYKSGEKNSEGGMASGMIHTGTWTGYFENGTKNYEGAYNSEGMKVGVWKWWDEKGNETTEQTYQNGNLTNTKNLK
jgi:hypothetical protein